MEKRGGVATIQPIEKVVNGNGDSEVIVEINADSDETIGVVEGLLADAFGQENVQPVRHSGRSRYWQVPDMSRFKRPSSDNPQDN